jgi:cytoskeletal protein CcmA (bactofilin family)
MALFNSDKNAGDAVSKDASTGREGAVPTIIGKGSEFEGKLTFEGQVRIEGKFSGTITSKDQLIISDSAKVTAEIFAGTLVCSGTVEGNIKATGSVELKPPARVKGSIETPILIIERGVLFDGSAKMDTAGKASPPPPGAQAK